MCVRKYAELNEIEIDADQQDLVSVWWDASEQKGERCDKEERKKKKKKVNQEKGRAREILNKKLMIVMQELLWVWVMGKNVTSGRVE